MRFVHRGEGKKKRKREGGNYPKDVPLLSLGGGDTSGKKAAIPR